MLNAVKLIFFIFGTPCRVWGICADYRASGRLLTKKRRSAPLSADLPTVPPRLMTLSRFLVSRDLKIFSQLLCCGCCLVHVWYCHRGCALSENCRDCVTFEILVPRIHKRECVNASYSRGLLRQALSSTAYFSALPHLKRCRILIPARIKLGNKKTCTYSSWRNHTRINGGTGAVKYKAKIILPALRLFIASCFNTNHILERTDRLKAEKNMFFFFYIYSKANMKRRGHGSVL